jgi:hypothetical protein
VIKRLALFTTWALLGGLYTFGAIYLFTPLGVAVLVPAVLVGWRLPVINGERSPEVWGLLAGPGIFCALLASSNDDSAWALAALGFVLAACGSYLLAGRARCARA